MMRLHGFADSFGEVTLAAGSHTCEWVGFGTAARPPSSVGCRRAGRGGPIHGRQRAWHVVGDPDRLRRSARKGFSRSRP